MTYLEATIILLLVMAAVTLVILSVVVLMPDAINSWKQLRQRDRLMSADDVVSYDTCVEREQAAFDAALDKALDAIDYLKFKTHADAELAPYDIIAVHNRALDAAHTAVNELRESEIWHAYGGRKLIVPKGTFDKIWNDADEDDEDFWVVMLLDGSFSYVISSSQCLDAD